MWYNISGEAAGDIWNWSLLGVKGLNMWCVPCKDMTKGPEQSIYKFEMHNIVWFGYINEWFVYLYRLTTQVASWTEDIELRDNNNLLIIMHCKAVMYFSQWCKLCQEALNPRDCIFWSVTWQLGQSSSQCYCRIANKTICNCLWITTMWLGHTTMILWWKFFRWKLQHSQKKLHKRHNLHFCNLFYKDVGISL